MVKKNPPKDLKEMLIQDKILQNIREEGDFSEDEVMVVEEDGKTNGGPFTYFKCGEEGSQAFECSNYNVLEVN